ncbi:MAG: hypothetical protein MUP98_17075, partial [Candidatus Aminicenantes bacterium]|nr:hypothetical protein [Candidatus Aminicenantes bacterium]
ITLRFSQREKLARFPSSLSSRGGTMPARPPNGFLHHLPRTLNKITILEMLPYITKGLLRPVVFTIMFFLS